MSLESLSGPEIRRRIVGWSVVTAAATTLTVMGIYDWMRQSDSSLSQQCSALNAATYDLEKELFQDGTLGSDGGLIVRYLEVRKPDDSRLRDWGRLKNEKDRICAEDRRSDDQSFNFLARMGALGGGAFVLLGIQNILNFRHLLRRNSR
ncbi:hypothetical protein HYU95_05815 [Candidatus Daviesbacteria bacterium]|nr:hypothetical protein [Candidatus Daviesbacteria bacterium]